MGVNLSQIINKDLPVKQSGKKDAFIYEDIPYQILATRSVYTYATDLTRKTLQRSQNFGKTWGSVLWTIPTGEIHVAHLTSQNVIGEGHIIVLSTDGKVYHSPVPTINFTEVLSGVAPPLNSYNISSDGNTVCFSEYQLTPGGSIRIFRSTNGGATFSVALTAGTFGTDEMSHFHNCQHFPGIGWIATLGDINTSWYHSVDGASWVKMFYSTDQRRRSIGMMAKDSETLVWTSDGGRGFEGVFQTTIKNGKMREDDIIKICHLPTTSYTGGGAKNIMFAPTLTLAPHADRNAFIYYTLDGGNSWVADKKFTLANVPTGGFKDTVGPDAEGSYYFTSYGLKDKPDYTTVKAIPNHMVDKQQMNVEDVYVARAIREKLQEIGDATKSRVAVSHLNSTTLIGTADAQIGDVISSANFVTPLNISQSDERIIVVKNKHNVDLIVQVRIYATSVLGISANNRIFTSANITVSPNTEKIITKIDIPQLAYPAIGLSLYAQRVVVPSSGSADYIVIIK